MEATTNDSDETAMRIEKFHAYASVMLAMGEDSAAPPYNGDPDKVEARMRELGVHYDDAAAQHLDAREPKTKHEEFRCTFCGTPKLVGFVSALPEGTGARFVLTPGIDPVACIACARARHLRPFDKVKP